MLEYLKEEANKTLTENGAVTLKSSMSVCVDLFGTIGALRSADDAEIARRFSAAYKENPDVAMKILFFSRDVRGGLGERRVPRVIFKWLAANKPESLKKNLQFVAEFGRWDDLLCLIGTACEADVLELIKTRFEADLVALEENREVSLLAKWLPSVNTSNSKAVANGKKIAKSLGLKEADYRKALSALRGRIRIIENALREKDYSFDYSKQPSKAMFKYRKAFIRNDGERYSEFLGKVVSGEEKLHTGNVAPYEVIRPIFETSWARNLSPEEEQAINTTWNSLEDFGNEENAIAVVDTSGSMWGLPILVAISLGLYFAEHNTGEFRNHFITFSHAPELVEILGDTVCDKVRNMSAASWGMNTNLEKVFDLLLNTAVAHSVPAEEMPKKLYIISDMEFDFAVSSDFRSGVPATFYETMKGKWASAGYELPAVVFWNVNSRNAQQPVKFDENGTALVSGCSPRLFSMVVSGDLNPESFMLSAIMTERYSVISA